MDMDGIRNHGRGRRIVGLLVALIVVMASAGAVFATVQAPVADPTDVAAREARQALCLETQKTALDARVEAGTLTQAEADARYAEIQERIEACDGTATGVGTMRRYGRGAMNGSRGGMNSSRGGNAGVCIVTPAA
jgi:hypothetical protein